MYHAIEFAVDCTVDLVRSRKEPLERLKVRRGMRRRAQIRPYVVEGDDGPVEVADLFFDDGTTARRIRFAYFAFVN